MLCEFILASTIVGAMEIAPGSMRVEFIHPQGNGEIETIFLYTDDYIGCLERPPIDDGAE